MKVTLDIDCSPEEARAFLGLPDVQPMQDALMKELQTRLSANLKAMDPEAMIKTWLPAGIEGAEQMQKMFWSQLQQTMAAAAQVTSGALEGFTEKARK
jgi:hypothetical protein